MRTLLIAAIVLAIASPANAGESVEQQPALSISANYTAEGWNLASDDLRSHSAYLDNLDLIATADGEVLFGVPGLQLFAYAIYDNGHVLNEAVADTLQGISNIEATKAFRMYEAWAQWQLGSVVSLRAGLYDLNSEFDAVETAGLFINPSHGIGADFAQSGVNGPSIFPVTSIAARLRMELDHWDVQVAVLDAVPGDVERPTRTTVRWDSSEGLLYVGEASYRVVGGARLGLGYWRYSEAFETMATGQTEPVELVSNDGSYVFAETAALKMSRGALSAFARAGRANDDVNSIGSYIGAGATWSGFARAEDEVGFAIARARVGEPWRRTLRADDIEAEHAETILEITARLPVGEYVVVQPDVQYVHHPGALAGRADIWAFGLRLEIGLALER